ncbi:Ig-like domain-containing protein, partial [Flavobacteriaceae bacterium]|nr:Ig-like domain-containing protein [Flavobacteriaceae bacterium]
SAIGTITMGTGTLNLVVATDVTSAAFADNSSAAWGTGSLVITGAGNNEVSFGTSAAGITAAQLAQITMDGFSSTINSSGYINSNVAPVAVDDTLTVSEDAAVTPKNVIANDTDADANTLSLTAVATAGTGTVAINDDGLSVNYTPAADFNGTETITYTVSDGERTDATGTLTVTVTPVNDSPVAAAQSVTTVEDISVEITLSGSDIDGDTLTYEVVTGPLNGTVTLTGIKATYLPNSGYFGSDSFTYKTNDGTIDSSIETISISVTSNDFDEDGILNNEDECPDTPEGTVVDYKGCPTFVLPENNNKVEITSATCIGYSDGSIGLSVVDTSYDYTITITGNTDVLLTGSNNKASVTGLAKGTYTVCFKVDGEPEYEQCFDVLIEEPERISVYMDVDIDNKTSSFQLSGSNIYNIDVNGTLHKVNKDSFTTSLPTGLSIIKIYTDLDCQGIIEKEVFISEDIMYYPNPTINDVNVHISGMDKKVMISVFSEKGDLVLRKEQQVQDLSRLTEIDLSLQNTGTYIVVMEGKTVRKTFKIIKK